jgi:myxalamid-type nonribosomal peptide synthetase MxaA
MSLSPQEKRDLLARLLSQDGGDDRKRLSMAQQRTWFLEHLAPGTAAHHAVAAFTLEGDLSLACLQQALAEVVRRHDVLRMSLVEVDGSPHPIVAPAISLPITVLDAEEHEVASIVARKARHPFDMARGPFLRACLIRLDLRRHALVLVAHSLVADEPSLRQVMRELVAVYGGLAAGTGPPPLPRRSFPAWAARQWAWLQSEAGLADEEWWRRHLEGLATSELPADRPRPPTLTTDGATRRRVVPAETIDALRDLLSKEGATLFDALLAGLWALVGRYAGTADVAVGSPAPADADPQREALVGPLASPVVLRGDLSDDPPFRVLVRRARDERQATSEHSALPFERVVEVAHPRRDLSRSPLFQVELSVSAAAPDVLEAAGLVVVPLPVDLGVASYDLSITAGPAADGSLELTAVYATALFDAESVDRLLGHYQALLTGGARDPDRPVATVDPRLQAERAAVAAWSLGPPAPIADVTVAELLAAQVPRASDALAVVDARRSLTFAELERSTNRLAHFLQAMGVRPETRVAVCLERSVDLVVALVAVLKAGGAYVPLDPGYPAERLAFLLEDAGPLALLTQDDVARRLPPHGALTVRFDADAADIAKQPDHRPPTTVTDRNLAYLIYTSGSTGTPKATMVEHRGLTNYVTWARDYYDVAAGRGSPVHSSVAFDMVVTALFAPLLAGRTVTMLSEDDVVGIGALADVVRSGEPFSFLKLTPSHLELLSQWVPADVVADAANCIVLGGEALRGESLAYWRRHAPSCRVVNEYGPTEAIVGCCVYEAPPGPVAPGDVPIGRPIGNTSLHVLDPSMRPVPAGTPGELYIGGAGVARGYAGRPALTAERFVPDPYSRDPGARLYRTGDLVRYRHDGELVYLGRADDQVKVRGYRIELGEIESVVAQHPAVRQAVVAAREDVPGDKRLIAYIVSDGPAAPARGDLLSFLEQRLPAHMVPAAVVVLKALPLNANGKVDRKVLPPPDRERPDLANVFVAPRTPLEEDLGREAADLLGLERIGVNDDFFELGGHSLLVARLFARVTAAYGVDLPVECFFAVPTVAGLARAIDAYHRDGREAAMAAMPAVDLLREARLDVAITAEGRGRPSGLAEGRARRVLVTGATGFLGAFLVAELVRATEAEICCLVRGGDDQQAGERLRSTLESYGVWTSAMSSRVRAIAGDLAQPLLGLGAASFSELAQTVDAIYHSGALVNFVYPYSALKATNVLGTQEVLRLACQGPVKAVHYVSALDVFVSGTDRHRLVREEELGHPVAVPHGYVQSKWVAERLVAIAGSRGLPVTVYRPWVITGHSQTGVCHTTDFFYLVLKGCLELELAPALDMVFNAMPVDYVSQGIVRLSLQDDAAGRIFHFANPAPAHISRIYEWLRASGYRLDEVPYTTWRKSAVGVGPTNALYPITPLLREEGPYPEELNPRIDCRNTLRGLAGSGVMCPPFDERLVETYIEHLVRTGFLPAPRAAVVPG